MRARLRTVSALAILAMAASLVVAPGLLSPASARSAAPERTSITAECAAAQSALASAKAGKAQAHHQVVKARKALRKAKHSHRPAKIRKAKRVLKRWKHRYAVRTHDVHVQYARVGYACSAPTSSAHATGVGMDLNLLALASGLVPHVIDTTQLTTLLEQLLPGVTGNLDAGQLGALLAGFNTAGLSLDDVTILLGSTFTPDQLTALLGGTASTDVVQALADHIVGQLSALAGGSPVPGSPVDLTAVVDTLVGILGTAGGGGTGTVVCTLLPLLC